ncbi:hypothetical protein KY366_05820 [Candidatus Woesearchaeota archaeon]|nr:hypothetical protein [Candidatus Woesearchaeota archaeon]
MKSDYQHYSNMAWYVHDIYFVAISTFYLYARGKQDLILNLFGIILTVHLLYLAASFRVLKHCAFKEAKDFGEMVPYKKLYKIHLDQWFPYMIIIWFLGLLWLWELSGFFEHQLEIHIIFSEIWTAIAAFFTFYYRNKFGIL